MSCENSLKKSDKSYMDLISALESKDSTPKFGDDNPLSEFGSVWDQLSINELQAGKLVLLGVIKLSFRLYAGRIFSPPSMHTTNHLKQCIG